MLCFETHNMLYDICNRLTISSYQCYENTKVKNSYLESSAIRILYEVFHNRRQRKGNLYRQFYLLLYTSSIFVHFKNSRNIIMFLLYVGISNITRLLYGFAVGSKFMRKFVRINVMTPQVLKFISYITILLGGFT